MARSPSRSRLGWLGPVIVGVGLVVGGIGVWWMLHARPEPGDVIDRMAIDGEWSVVVRRETSSDRAFVELTGKTRGQAWQALVPRYAGRPGASGLAAAKNAVSVRVIRQKPELWVLSTIDATKLGGIALDGYAPGGWDPAGRSAVVTVGDGERSFEVVDGVAGAAVIAIDLERGSVLWHHAMPGPVASLTLRSPSSIEVVATDGSHVLDRRTGVDERAAVAPTD